MLACALKIGKAPSSITSNGLDARLILIVNLGRDFIRDGMYGPDDQSMEELVRDTR